MLNKPHKNPEPISYANKFSYNDLPESVCDELDALEITQEEREYFANPTPENYAKCMMSHAATVH